MAFYSFEMILVGIILLSAMGAGGIKLWLKKRRDTLEPLGLKDDLEKLDSKKTSND